LEAQWAQVSVAIDQATTNYLAENNRQLAEISERIREQKASQGGYEKELQLARGGRR